jgi:hypothetical protein
MKFRRNAAKLAVILIVALYASAIVFALMDSPLAEGLLLTSLFMTVVVPAFLYGLAWLTRMNRRNVKDELTRDAAPREDKEIPAEKKE